MKATKELKRILLEGFEKMLTKLSSAGYLVAKCESNGDECDQKRWVEKRSDYFMAIMEGINSLIEVEGE